MSAPAGEPTPTPEASGTPAPEPAPQAPASPEPTVTPEAAPEAPPVKTFDEDYVRKLRDEAAKYRTGKTEAEQKAAQAEALIAQFRKALDPNAAPDEDPKVIAERAIAERDARTAELTALRVERAAERAARAAGADVDALLDSRGFEAALRKLDPGAATFDADLTAAVTAAIEANPRLKANQPPVRTATDTKTGSTPPGQLSREALKNMSAEEIVAAKEAGRLSSLLGG